MDSQVWFITGSSRGLGRTLVEELLRSGHRVVATARRPEALADLGEGAHAERCLVLRLDVTQPNEFSSCVEAAIARFGRIDVLVNNAGYGLVGALEESPDEEIRQLFETNVFGVLGLTRAVLPVMRGQKYGRILNISSAAGFSGTAAFGIYNATKFAIEGFSEALAQEVASFGIRVTLIQPGPFRTGFAGESLKKCVRMTEYDRSLGPIRRYFDTVDGTQSGNPIKAAQAMIAVAALERPPLRLPLGRYAIDKVTKKCKSVLSELEEWESLGAPTDFE